MPIIQAFSNWPKSLYDFSLAQLTWNDWISFEETSGQFTEAENANQLRLEALNDESFAFWAWGNRFSLGVECLLKSRFTETPGLFPLP
jgi:hypothetical protein